MSANKEKLQFWNSLMRKGPLNDSKYKNNSINEPSNKPKTVTSFKKNSDSDLKKNQNSKDSEIEKTDGEILIPKDSVEVLEELIGMKPNYNIKAESNKKIFASVQVYDKVYHGSGKSKSIAKQSVAEKALKDLLFNDIMSTVTNNTDNYLQYNKKSWRLLGSYAMFKLIEEWLLLFMEESEISSENNLVDTDAEKDLNSINDNNNTTKTVVQSNAVNTTGRNYNVDNKEKKVIPSSSNPSVLLNSLLGSNLNFTDLRINGALPPFCFACVVDDIEYVGEPSQRKKQAKSNAAKKVLIKKFGYQFSNS